MSWFKPIDPSLRFKHGDNPSPRETCPQSASRYRLSQIGQWVDEGRYAYSWGYTIFRTYYGGADVDEKFTRAIRLLDIYATFWALSDLEFTGLSFGPDSPPETPQVCYEVTNRRRNIIIEHRESLENATLEEVARQFDLWVKFNNDCTPDCGPTNPRFRFCIMLDEESVLNILTLPEKPGNEPRYELNSPSVPDVWTKVVTSEVLDGGERVWLRIDVYEELWGLWFLDLNQDTDFEEFSGGFKKTGPIDMIRGYLGIRGPDCRMRFSPRGVIPPACIGGFGGL